MRIFYCKIDHIEFISDKRKNGWFEKLKLAVDNNCKNAQQVVGYMYSLGDYVEKSDENAVKYLLSSANSGNYYEQDELTRLFLSIFKSKLKLQEQIDNLTQQNQQLQQENNELKMHIKYMPGGSGYQESKDHFDKLAINI